MKEEKKSCNPGCLGCYARRALAATERMQMQQELVESVMRSPISIMMLSYYRPLTAKEQMKIEQRMIRDRELYSKE